MVPAFATSTDGGISTSGITSGTTVDPFEKRTTSVERIPRRAGRNCSAAWPRSTGGPNRSSRGGEPGSRVSSRGRIPPLRGTRRSSFHLADGGRLPRPAPLSHRGQVDAQEGERSSDPDRDPAWTHPVLSSRLDPHALRAYVVDATPLCDLLSTGVFTMSHSAIEGQGMAV